MWDLSPKNKNIVKYVSVGSRWMKVFSYDKTLTNQIRKIPAARYIKKGMMVFTPYWIVPLSTTNIILLKQWGFSIDSLLMRWYKSKIKGQDPSKKSKVIVKKRRLRSVSTPLIKGDLRHYQKQGIAFLECTKGRGILADDMGLGKTVQVIGWMSRNYDSCLPAVVVCPSTAKYNWLEELNKWLKYPLHIEVLEGRNNVTFDKLPDIIIVNYDILQHRTEQILQLKPKTIILDEAHRIRNRKTKCTKAVFTIAKNRPYFIAMDGTPIMHRPYDIYNVAYLVKPDLFQSHFYFTQRYCRPDNQWGKLQYKGASNIDELHAVLSSIMIRRVKEEVLTELPKKQRAVVPLHIDNIGEYRKALQAFKKQMSDDPSDRLPQLAQLEKLKQLVVEGKMNQVIKWIKDYLDSERKLVVFCTHKKTIQTLLSAFPSISLVIDGSVTGTKRQKTVNTFQTDNKKTLLLGNLKAAGESITLTAASATVHIELGWSPMEHYQAEDRVNRISQKADSIFAYYLVGLRTIEQDIALMLDKKAKIINRIIEGKNKGDMSLLIPLLKRIRKM